MNLPFEAAPEGRPASAFLALAVGIASFSLYWLTLAPGVVSISDDTLEFQMVAQRAAIPHPTGYPLFAILLSLAARLILLGEVAFRANVLSAIIASATVALTFVVARRTGLSWIAALLSSFVLAISPTFWSQATVAEVYPLHLLLVAALSLALFSWGGARRERTAGPVWAALAVGLGMAHHRTIALWLPAAALYAAIIAPTLYRPGPHWRALLAAGLFPLALYLWLPLRAEVGSIDGTYQEVGFGCWIMACQYGGFFADNALAAARPLSFYGALAHSELGLFTLVMALGGLVFLSIKQRATAVFLIVGLITNVIFAINYRVPDPEVFWLPVTWVLALLAGWGMQGMLALWRGIVGSGRQLPRLGSAVLGTGALLLLVLRGITILPAADRSAVSQPPEMNGYDVLAQPLPENAVVIGLLGEATYLRYLQEARGLHPWLQTVAVPTDPLEERFQEVESALANGQRPYLTTELPGAGERWSMSALGPLVEVYAEPREEAPVGMWPLELPVGEPLRVVGWSRSPVEGTDQERITISWQVINAIDEPLSVSARLVGAEGSVKDMLDRPPLRNSYPTTFWRPGEIILDTYELDRFTPGDQYQLILYRPSDGSEIGRAEWAP